MQVSYAQDHVTHAVIGGGETIDFGISNSAEFFNILSSTLYKDQILAVVRESLCNAWDAHIEAGCTDKPVLVTLESNKLIIRDFGKGIHHEDIGLIYGTYGNSTKKNDGSQTGGFGLGCKSPFAYTDHFEVISNHDGARTIYAMAKSSAEVGGKPGIKTIAQFATTETGLSVTINVKPGDISRFAQLIKRIARNGDMNIHFNGTQVAGIDFDVATNNWMITNTELLDVHEPVVVRYGNVIYPIDGSHKEISSLYSQVSDITQSMSVSSHYSTNPTLLFQAPPHSIAVTPSRESLSMQDHTVNTLKKLMSAFIADFKKHVPTEQTKALDEFLDKAVTEGNYRELLNPDPVVPYHSGVEQNVRINTFDAYAKRFIRLHYPEGLEFRKMDVTKRVTKLSAAGYVDRGRVQTFLEDLKGINYTADKQHRSYSRYGGDRHKTDWLQRRVISKLLIKLAAAGLEQDALLLCDSNDRSLRYEYSQYPKPVKASIAAPKNLYTCLPYLRNIVVLATSRTDICERVRNLDTDDGPLESNEYQYLDGFLVYIAGRKKGDLEKAQTFFAKSKMTVIDMTELEEVEEKPVKTKDPVVRLKGLPTLRSVLSMSSKYINTGLARESSAERVLVPEFVTLNQSKNSGVTNELPWFDNASTKALITLFGDVCGLANSSAQYETWKKKFPDAQTYLVPKVMDFVRNSKAIQTYITKSQSKASDYWHELKEFSGYIVPSIYNSPHISKHFGITDERNATEALYYTLLMCMYNYWGLDTAVMTEIRGWMDAPLDPKIKGLLDQAADSKMLRIIDLNQFDRLMVDPLTSKKAMQMFFYALKN